MSDTMMRFANQELAENFLTDEQLMAKCPAAFKETPTNPGVSSRYVQANTLTVINDLRKLGWFPVDAKQCRAKKNSSGIRSYHMISFQNPDVYIKKELNDGGEFIEAYPRIILTNSHDGFNSFKFMLGIFRLICSNGLVVGDEMINMPIKHINYDFETLRDVVKTAVESVPNIVMRMNEMKKIVLNEDEKKELAIAVVKIRKNIPEEEKFELDEETIMDILEPNRHEDKSDDLWTVFNVCQEKMTKGGFFATVSNNKSRKQRGITSIKRDVDCNQKLWLVASRFMPANSAA